MDKILRTLIKTCLNIVIESAFIDPTNISEEEGFALLLSKYFQWSPDSIMMVTSAALEDANCHTLKTKIDNLMK